MPFADWLREQMRARDLSNADLARQVNVGRVTVTSWLRGRSVPYTETCTRLAAALDVPLDEVMRWAGYRA